MLLILRTFADKKKCQIYLFGLNTEFKVLTDKT